MSPYVVLRLHLYLLLIVLFSGFHILSFRSIWRLLLFYGPIPHLILLGSLAGSMADATGTVDHRDLAPY